MTCPECGAKIGAKNYDAEFEWYECPKCEGAFTGDEIVEAEEREHSRGVDSGSNNGRSNSVRVATKPVAKKKKKQAEIDADAEAIAEYEKRTTETVVVSEKETRHRDEISTGQVVQIMADEIEAIYEEMAQTITRDNAEDKALTLWRNLRVHDGITAREKAVELALCGEHS